MSITISIIVLLFLSSVFTLLYLILVNTRKQSDALIRQELDAGKAVQFKTSVGGVVGGIR